MAHEIAITKKPASILPDDDGAVSKQASNCLPA